MATEKYHGICATCRHAQSCAHRVTAGVTIQQCEEFDGYAPPPKRDAGEKTPRPEAPSPSPKGAGQMGLCVNCEYRDTCVLPRPEGGVWHCNEYR